MTPPQAPARTSAAAPVAINARAAIRAEIGGVERFARELALRLPALRPDRYRVIRPPAGLAHRAGHLWEQLVLPIKTLRCALLLSPANLAPVIGRANVVVIHDAAALKHPEAYTPVYVSYQRRILPLIAARARLVLTVSEFSRRELIDLLGVSRERVRVVPEGVDERFSPQAHRAAAVQRYGLARPYVLCVGTVSDRKNLVALEPAARVLGEQGIELVLAGSDRGYMRGPATMIRRLGYVPEPELPGLYAGAVALVMPSRYEGFGLPCLEAMASGVPVVAANAGALPETCGDAALLVPPGEPDKFAAALRAVSSQQGLRARLIAEGVARAARFSWGATASQTDAAIGELLTSA